MDKNTDFQKTNGMKKFIYRKSYLDEMNDLDIYKRNYRVYLPIKDWVLVASFYFSNLSPPT
ncbi:MAG: hypothetical protein ACTSPY_03485 [Candidatus Helarchaeota archaeon]